MNKRWRIPNLRWLASGVVFTLALMFGMRHMPWAMQVSMAVGILVACCFLVFQNPVDQEHRFDISLCVPFLAIMWPIILVAMLLSKPWNDPKWKDRQTRTIESDEAHDTSESTNEN